MISFGYVVVRYSNKHGLRPKYLKVDSGGRKEFVFDIESASVYKTRKLALKRVNWVIRSESVTYPYTTGSRLEVVKTKDAIINHIMDEQ